jgi:hypothetical protein
MNRRYRSRVLVGLVLALGCTVAVAVRAPSALAQAPFYYGYPSYPFPFGTNPISMTPITTTNTLGSTALVPAPVHVPVALAPAGGTTSGSYCTVGDEQIWVPAGASPAAYGC